jgi:hypothetical protein
MNTPPNDNPLLRAFFLGRAAAELLLETVEKASTELFSELGKFDAEQRVNLRRFVDEVNVRAEQAMGAMPPSNPANSAPSGMGMRSGNLGNLGNADLQTTIDDLRAEIAEVRTELNRYRSTSNN